MKDTSKNPALAPSSTAPSATSSAKAKVASPEKGTLVKKKNTAAGGASGTTGHRSHTTATSGARYGIRVKLSKSVAPEAGATQSNGRLLSSAIKRSAPEFTAGIADHN